MNTDNGTALVPMNAQALAPASVNAAAYFSPEQRDLIKRTVAKGCTEDEFQLFLYQCARTGLDPLSRQIYALKRREWSQELNSWEEKLSIQTGIDGFRLIADRTSRYAPGRETVFEYDAAGNLRKATAYVLKRTNDGTWHEVSASAFYDEYVQVKKDGTPTKMWTKKHMMLGKCAESLAHRKAFPAEMSGLYTTDEMAQAVTGVDDAVEYTAPKAETPKQPLPKTAPATLVELVKAKLDEPLLPRAEPPPKQTTPPPANDVDERALRINKLCTMREPDGLGWTKVGAKGWLRKRFGVDATNRLTEQQKQDAETLLVARMDSEDTYRTKVEWLAEQGRCNPDAPPDENGEVL